MNKTVYRLISTVVAVALIFGNSHNVHASTTEKDTAKSYIVDNNNIGGNGCNDEWPGTLEQPLCTIGQGIALLQAGEILYVRAGTYPSFSVTKSNITISGYNNEMPLVNTGEGIKLIGTSYVTLRGFEVTGMVGNWTAAIMIINSGNIFPTYNTIEYNKVHDNTHVGMAGIRIKEGSYNKILNNEIYNNYFVGIRISGDAPTIGNEVGYNNIYNHTMGGKDSDGMDLSGVNVTGTYIHNNIFFGNADDGLDTWDSEGNIIIGNIAFNQNGVGDGNGFKLGGGADGGHNIVKQNIAYNNKARGFTSNRSGGNVFYNNVSYNNDYGFEDANKVSASTASSTFINNIGYNNKTANFSADRYTGVAHNNIWYSDNGLPKVQRDYYEYASLVEFYQATGLDNPNGELASLQVNPQFIDAPGQIFDLSASSPAIDQGDPSNPGQVAAIDVVDIGALESPFSLPPTVTSFTRVESSPYSLTNTNILVTFSKTVTGVDITDFVLTANNLLGASISEVSGSGRDYLVKINLGWGIGTIHLDLLDNDSITDMTFKPLGGEGIGNGDFTTGETYTIKNPVIAVLQAPLPRSPQTNLITNNTLPTFWWTDVIGAQKYELVFSTSSAFSNTVSSQIVSGTSYTALAPFGTGKYYWRVRAYNLNNQPGKWSTSRIFTIDVTPPAAPILSTPGNNTTLRRTPTFKWRPSSTAVLYEYQLDNNADFSSLEYTVIKNVTSITPPGLPVGIYTWRVRAQDAAGNWSTWSAPFTITISNP